MSKKTGCVLVTGAAGFLGSHTLIELFGAGYQVIALDNLCNSKFEALRRVAKLARQEPVFYQLDVCDEEGLTAVFAAHQVDAVIHFAALKSVNESIAQALQYYQNNVGGTLNLLKCMQQAQVRRIVFSSSATVYQASTGGEALTENSLLGPVNPYGRSKLMMEEILRDLAQSEPGWYIALLRYFNPVGAHQSGLIGEDPNGIPNNLMPYISQVAVGKQPILKVYGADYPTLDGTGVRDYIHVMDLACAHVKALNVLQKADRGQKTESVLTVNIGTGKGYSVLELINAFTQASGREIPFAITQRRAGDIACCYADASLAQAILGWRAQRTLADMCQDSWRWQQQNPEGYLSEDRGQKSEDR